MLRAPYRNTFDTMNSDWDYTNHLYRTEIRIYASLVSICNRPDRLKMSSGDREMIWLCALDLFSDLDGINGVARIV